MSYFTAIDLSALPSPDVIEALDYESVLVEMVADYRARYPEFSAALESEPVVKVFEVLAYREVNLRARVNDAAKAVMVASAAGADLDNLAAFFGVTRLDGEDDARLRNRVVLAPEGYAAAGPADAYRFHALSADPSIVDVSAVSPKPGRVAVTVMGRDSNGAVSADVVKIVLAALSSDDVRPLTDALSVKSVEVIYYDVAVDLYLFPGPDGPTVRDAALAALSAYATSQHVIGRDITRSGLIAAAHRTGVQRAEVRLFRANGSEMSGDLAVDVSQTASLRNLTVKVAGRAE